MSKTPRPWKEWRVERVHDLWVEIVEGYGISHRMVADCLRSDDAAAIVAAVNACHALKVASADLEPKLRALLKALEPFREVAHHGSHRSSQSVLLNDATGVPVAGPFSVLKWSDFEQARTALDSFREVK